MDSTPYLPAPVLCINYVTYSFDAMDVVFIDVNNYPVMFSAKFLGL